MKLVKKMVNELFRVKTTILILSSRKNLQEPKDSNIGISNGQATKSVRGMPWHQEPTKDAAICEKLWVGESSQ